MEKSYNNGNNPSQPSRLFEKQGSTTRATTFASLSLHQQDRLRLMQFSTTETQAIRYTINNCWPRGVQDEREYYGSHEFKLGGYPWLGSSDDAVYARRFMCKVLETLANLGWVLTVSTYISKKSTDKDTLVFRHQQPPPARCDWMAISFSNHDLIRFIDTPQPLVDHMIQQLHGFTQRHQRHHLEGTYEIKINGYPWNASGSDTMQARRIVLKLLEGLDYSGWTVYASIEQKSGPGGETDRSETDTWHCCRPVGWSSDLPVYHK